MTQGKQRAARQLLVAQAALVWADEKTDVEGYLETGNFGSSSCVIDYDPETRAAFAKAYEAQRNGGQQQ